MRMLTRIGAAIVIATAGFMSPASLAAQGLTPAQQRGLTFVRTHCATCHAIGKTGASPLAIAPPLRDLHRRYPVEALEEAFAEGIVTGHPSMPEFRLDPGQISDVMAYLKWLE